jgi:hypothetical protein
MDWATDHATRIPVSLDDECRKLQGNDNVALDVAIHVRSVGAYDHVRPEEIYFHVMVRNAYDDELPSSRQFFTKGRTPPELPAPR